MDILQMNFEWNACTFIPPLFDKKGLLTNHRTRLPVLFESFFVVFFDLLKLGLFVVFSHSSLVTKATM